jgi:CDP-diacylglycerol--glycerol-3-phosphate 3-phosphatidyltransferase
MTQDNDRNYEFNNTPNWLTLSRILLVPIVVFCLSVKDPLFDWIAAIVFAVASITDFFDGYLARKMNRITIYGKLMDPLADKFLVIASMVMLQDLGRIHPYIVIVVICREIAITGLRALASAEGMMINVSQGGKWKAAFQMVAIPLIMVENQAWGIPFYEIGTVLLLISLFMSLWSAQDYIFGFIKALTERAKLRRKKKLARKRKTNATE